MLNQDSTRMLGKLLYILKRLSYDWYCTKLCHANLNDFNNAHLPVFMSIGTKGISNSKLASKLSITKQAASKVIKELEELNLVRRLSYLDHPDAARWGVRARVLVQF